MTPGLDAGPCLLQQRTPIDPDEDAGELEKRLASLGADGVLQVIDQLETGTAKPIVQDKTLASKAPRLTKEQGAIDWSRPAQAIKNQVRGIRPWPRAFTFWRHSSGEPVRLNVDRVAVLPAEGLDVANNSPPAPGTVIEAATRLHVATGDMPLEILELQPAGKRAMSASEFLRGNRVAVGDTFGSAD